VKRIGYVGLSTPSFYDYRNPANAPPPDGHSSPNPVIEGAFGALLLYDEIWFLCRSLCPENMRGLPYVKFLDETGKAPALDPNWLPPPDQVFDREAVNAFSESSGNYSRVREEARIYWDAAADNHTHALNVAGVRLNGNSWDIRNVVYDVLVAERLPGRPELITNSFSSVLFRKEASARDRLVLSEILVLDSVPQFLTPQGPYHPCVEEVRASRYLAEFRSWIGGESASASPKTVSEVKAEVEAKLEESQRQVFLKYLDPRGTYKSLAETVVGVGMDALVPLASTVKDLIGELSEEKKKQGLRWQGFILDARSKIAGAR
jgi:hypothetical protein